LREKCFEAKEAVALLEAVVDKCTSFKEKAFELVEEANRALTRLQQVLCCMYCLICRLHESV
jgi:hypothetical protein